MTPAILASGTERRASLGLAAAVAVEAAVLTGAGTLLVEVGEGAQRRGPTLLASPGAREVEEALRAAGLRGLGARAHLPPGDARSRRGGRRAGGCRRRLGGGARGRSSARAGSGSRRSRPRASAIAGGCLLVSLPAERSLAALAVEELARRRLPCRVATRPPAQLASRRALAGVRAGGRVSELAAGIARRLLGLGAGADRRARARPGAAGSARRRADPDPRGARAGGDRRRGDRRGPGAEGGGPGGALGGAQHARRHPAAAGAAAAPRRGAEPAPSLQAGVPGAGAPGGGRRRPAQQGRPRPAADRLPGRRVVSAAPGPRDGRRRDRPAAAARRRSARRQPAQSGWSPRRSPRRRRRFPPGPGCRRRRRAVGTPARSSTGTARGCGPTSPRPTTGWPRRLAVRASTWWSSRDSAPTRSRRELFAQHPDPRWVAPPGHSLHRCATELDLGPSSAYGWLLRARAPLRLPAPIRLGGLALRLPARARRRAHRPATPLRPAWPSARRRGWRRSSGAAGLRPRRLPRAAAALGLALERLAGAARGAADGRVGVQPEGGLAGGRARDRPVHPVDRRARTASGIPSTPSPRSTPRRT